MELQNMKNIRKGLSLLEIIRRMRKLYLVLLAMLISSLTNAQTPEIARTRMTEGKYLAALNYWHALNDDSDKYLNEIKICQSCSSLQQQALKYIRDKQYTAAIEKYNRIISLNPKDKNAYNQILRYQRLFDETTALSYSNTELGYTISYPPYLKQQSSSMTYKVCFASDDMYNIQLNIVARKEYDNISVPVSQFLQDKVISYLEFNQVNATTITVKLIKNNWMVVSGRFPNGNIFYNKTFVVTKRSSAGKYFRLVVSAVAISAPNDKRANQLADCIAKSFNMDMSDTVADEVCDDKTHNAVPHYRTDGIKVISVDTNGEWEEKGTSRMDSRTDCIQYQSSSNWHQPNKDATMTITIKGYSSFRIGVSSSSEGAYDYVMTSLNNLPTRAANFANTKGKSYYHRFPDTIIYKGLDETQSYTIYVTYTKDSGINAGEDRGYVFIPYE